MKLDRLSPLEKNILKQLWPNKQLIVREIYTVLKRRQKVALTSIAVALDRLYTKKLVDRTIKKGPGGLRYLYFPKKTKEEFERSIVHETVDKLVETFGSTALSYFNQRFAKKK